YRYYSFDQIHHIWMIMFCIELDIPLKEFAKFTDTNDTMDFRTFLNHGKEIAEEKIKALKRGLKLISSIEEQIDLADSYKAEQIYTRDLQEKYFYVKPCGGPLKGIDLLSIYESFDDMPYIEEDYNDLSQYGFICERTSSVTSYYAFIEVPRRFARKIKKNIKTIPAGTYACRQSDESQFEQAPEIFKEYLAGKESFLAIETEIFTGKHKINKPLNELRVIGL
ncbi:MAG: hypothetical protein FWD05_06425, partial [Oscillospiraceae bacterium]|nr:hypothetical protein [Oscillospiraceae bacterium]